MNEITHLIDDFKRLSPRDYVQQHPYPVLLHQTNRGNVDDKVAGYFTGVRQAREDETIMSPSPLAERQTARSSSGVLVFFVKPLLEDTSSFQVTVGRSSACDIQLPYNKVSGSHALFIRGSDGTSWSLEDCDATNGTYINKTRLAPHVPTPIKSGATVHFGSAQLTFRLAADFHAYLSRLLKAAQG